MSQLPEHLNSTLHALKLRIHTPRMGQSTCSVRRSARAVISAGLTYGTRTIEILLLQAHLAMKSCSGDANLSLNFAMPGANLTVPLWEPRRADTRAPASG